MEKVKVLRDFRHGHYGSRVKGKTFNYPADKDPAGFIKDGLVEPVNKPAASKAEKPAA